MDKDKIFFGQPIFGQLISYIDKASVNKLAREHKSDHYCKRFVTHQHLISMLYGILSGCNSLRELCSGIVSYGNKISHCQFDYAPSKSTLSDANKRRNYEVFEAIYKELVARYLPLLSDSQNEKSIQRKLYSIDSTTIQLFQSIFEGVGRMPMNGKRKGGIKSHQKLDMRAGIPIVVKHTDARCHDSLFIQGEGVANPGETLLFDKAYNNYALFDEWTKKDIRFVTRLKSNAKERFMKEYDLAEVTSDNVLRDAEIALPYTDETGKTEVKLRLVSYYDPEKQKALYFLTNLFDVAPDEIAVLYRKRWQIELLFKKIKQNFPLQYFYGQNRNAIQTQIWITLIALLLVSVLQKQIKKKKWAFSNLISLLQKHLFSYVKAIDFFENVDSFAKEYIKNSQSNSSGQLRLELSG